MTSSLEGLLGDEEIFRVEKPREDLICLLVDPPEGAVEMIPRRYYTLRVSLGDEEALSEGMLILRRLRGRMWPEYYREYSSRLDLLLKIHGILWASNKLLVVSSANPLSVLLMSSKAIDPRGSLSIVMVRDEDSLSLPEAVNSYSVLRIAEKRRIPSIIATERFLGDLSGYTDEWGYVDSREALSYIIRILSTSHASVFRSVSEDLDLGVNFYSISALIGASSSVFKSVSDAVRAMLIRSSVEMPPRDVLSLHIVAIAPKDIGRDIEQSYKELVRGYEGLLNHTLHLLDRDTRLGTYDIVALIGLREAPMLSSLERLYRQLAERNPEVRIESILGASQ